MCAALTVEAEAGEADELVATQAAVGTRLVLAAVDFRLAQQTLIGLRTAAGVVEARAAVFTLLEAL